MKDLKDREFGRLKVICYVGNRKWKCICSCGTVKDILGGSLTKSNGTKSCGCLFREVSSRGVKDRSTTHCMTKTTTWKTWSMMIQRCHNPKAKSFDRYGCRGISVCQRWRESFEAFLKDMGERPEGMTLDRYPNKDGNYEPGNCRWATANDQQRNMRSNHLLALNGETRCIAEWSEFTGIMAGTIIARLRRGWSAEKTLSTPTNTACRSVSNV